MGRSAEQRRPRPSSPTVRFLRYSFVGAIGTAVQYVPLVVLVQAAEVDPVLASTVGAVAGAIVNYALNHRHTFESRRRRHESLPRFMAIAPAGVAINAELPAALVNGLGVRYLAGQVVATLAVLGVTYLANRAWTFRAPPARAKSARPSCRLPFLSSTSGTC